jgi:hypothetical protein
MAAGLGFKTFNTGDVLSAADVNGYLMQGVLVFTDSTARDAAITSPQEGQFAYLKDTNTTTYYTGSAWTNLDTTGMVNPMTTTGDTIYSSSGSTPARLGIGTTGQVLTVAGGVPTWATPAGGGGKVLQVVNATTTTSTSTNGAFTNATNCSATITPSSASSKVLILISSSIRIYRANDYQTWAYARVRRSTTTVSPADYYFAMEIKSGTGGSNVGYSGTQFFNILDTPSTTSATTYQIQIQGDSGNGMYIVANPEGSTSITLMEIGA